MALLEPNTYDAWEHSDEYVDELSRYRRTDRYYDPEWITWSDDVEGDAELGRLLLSAVVALIHKVVGSR